MTPALITAQRAEDRARHERADERFRHDNAGEQKCTAAAEINQTCNESAPVIRKLFPNQKNEGNRSNRCQRTREPRSGSAYAEELERENDQPIKQRRFLQTRDAVVRWEEPSMSFDHLAGRPCILSLGLAVQIATSDRCQGSGKRSNFPAGISISASIWRHWAISVLSSGRVIRNAHQNRARAT